jgi:ankyrin repeat protein
MHQFAVTAASLIAATVSIGGCEQEPSPTKHLTLLALCESGDATPERAQAFLDRGADVNVKDERGMTPLHHAQLNQQNLELLTLFLEAGADANARGVIGTPLFYAAAYNKNPEAITLLIKAGADVNAKRKEGETPLDNAMPANAEILRAAGGKRGKDLP